MSAQRPVIGVSTTPLLGSCCAEAIDALARRGCDVRTYEADGSGGRRLERDARDGVFDLVIELALCELAAELTGAPGGAGPDRLTGAALRGIPQIIVLGGLDVIRWEVTGESSRRTAEFDGTIYARTTPQENDRLGCEIANKACASRGPVTLVLPLGGLSPLSTPGGPLHWPEADRALFQSLRNWLSSEVRVVEVNRSAQSDALVALVGRDPFELTARATKPREGCPWA